MSELRELKQGVGLLPVVALGLGTAIGVSIFSVIAPATELAGPAMLIAVPLAATSRARSAIGVERPPTRCDL